MQSKENTTLIFNCTYNCNDNCDFCFTTKKINKKIPEISLKDIKNNYYYLEKKYNINKIIISGGEPSIHSEFWELMNFFYNEIDTNIRPSLNTNSIIFADKNNFKKLVNILKNSINPHKQISLSFSSIKNIKKPSLIESKKIAGFKNTIKAALISDTQAYIVVCITKQNYKTLEDIAKFIAITVNQHKNKQNIIIQLRSLYLGPKGLTNQQESQCSPKNFKQVYPYVIKFIKQILKEEKFILNFYNIPLCLIKKDINISNLLKKTKYGTLSEDKRIMINHNEQLSKVSIGVYQGKPDIEICKNCFIKNQCNRIQQEYLNKGKVIELFPFKKLDIDL